MSLSEVRWSDLEFVQKESVDDEEDDLFGSNIEEDELCGEDGSGDFNHHQEEPEKLSVLRGVAVGTGAPGTGAGGAAAVVGTGITHHPHYTFFTTF